MTPDESFELLLDEVYEKGLGVSRKRMLAKNPHVLSYLYKDALATELGFLGERLVDRAFQNLPFEFRQDAARWQHMTAGEQEAVLKRMVKYLTTDRWLKIRANKSDDSTSREASSSEGIFPAQTKSWQRGPIQPNCLGMAQMLIGFASAAEADCYLITPLVPSWYSALSAQVKDFKLLLKQLETGFPDEPYVRQWRRAISRHVEGLLELMDTQAGEASHHAVAITLSDDSVWLVDPYHGICHKFDDKLREGGVSRRTLLRVLPRFSSKLINQAIERLENKQRVRSCVSILVKLELKYSPVPKTKKQWRTFYSQIIRNAVVWIDETADYRAWNVPVHHEVSPAYDSIAALTVNHWSAVRGIDGSKLLNFTVSQTILRDQLPLAGGERVDYLIGAYDSVDPSWLMPELRHVLKMKKKERNQ